MIEILTSKSCTRCSMAKEVLKAQGKKFAEVDENSERGQEIIDKHVVTVLPFFVLDETVGTNCLNDALNY